MMTTLTGLGRVARLTLRRDRVRLPLWLLGVCGIIISSAASLPPLYPDQASVVEYVTLFGDNPALVAFAGPGYGFDDPSLGVILVNETQLWGCIAVALMSIFLVNRHTRAEEDVERADLLRSSVVGRHAPTAAAVSVVAAANVVVGAVSAIAFIGLGYAATGSLALAASFTACGLVFTGVAVLAAQIASGSRATLGLASATLAAAFVLRAVGDIGDNALRWLSPIGWAQSVRAFADEQWWPLALCGAAALSLVVGAFWLATRRDLGSGLIAQRPGPARAARWITRPLGLAVRLQSGAVIGWAIGLFLVAVVYGSIGDDVEQMIEDNPAFADFLTQEQVGSITDSFFATSMSLLALFAMGFAISSTLRLRSEEAGTRAEPILAASVSRWRWAASHLVVAVVGTVVVMAAAGSGVGVAYAVVSGDAGQVLRLLGAALVTVPAILVLVGLAAALFGLAPRFALAAWAGLAVAAVIDIFGEILRLPDWSRQLSPLHHVPSLPAEELRLLPLGILLAIAAALVLAGLVGFRRRDLHTE